MKMISGDYRKCLPWSSSVLWSLRSLAEAHRGLYLQGLLRSVCRLQASAFLFHDSLSSPDLDPGDGGILLELLWKVIKRYV